MDEDGDVKNFVMVQVQVLDTVVLEETLEEVTRQEGQPALHEPGEHRDLVGVLLHWVRVARGCVPHVHLLLPENPLFTSASKSSVFALDFFHSLFGLGRGGDIGGDESRADPSASLWDLFFPTPVFMLLDGEDFILQVHRVFTHIRSGASLVAASGSAHGSTD
jgi:hypothetical protein